MCAQLLSIHVYMNICGHVKIENPAAQKGKVSFLFLLLASETRILSAFVCSLRAFVCVCVRVCMHACIYIYICM